MAKMKFGGPNLPDIATTWYRHVNPDGSYVGMVNVKPGDVVDAARVMDAESYVERGMATMIEEATKPAAKTVTKE